MKNNLLGTHQALELTIAFQHHRQTTQVCSALDYDKAHGANHNNSLYHIGPNDALNAALGSQSRIESAIEMDLYEFCTYYARIEDAYQTG